MRVETLKRYWGVIVLATIIGLVILLPTVLSINIIGLDNFKGIYPMFNDDEDYYLTLTKEVYDGHVSLSNPYIQEYKEGSYLFPPVPHIIYSFAANLLGISVVTMSVVNDFFLPFISVLLLYSLFWKITKGSKRLSLFLSGLFFLFFISTFGRPISPQFGFIFLLSGLNLTWLIVTNKHEVKKLILNNFSLAVCFGVLVYSYPFYWMTLGVVYALWTISVCFKDKDIRYWIKNWLAFFVPALAFSMPFIINTLVLKSNPLFIETNLRMGFINTHIPGSFFNVALMLLCIPAAYLLWNICKDRVVSFLPSALILSGVILNWQNIITGQTLQFPPHFYMVTILFIFIITAVGLSSIEKDKLGKYSFGIKFVILFMSVLLCLIFYKQRSEITYVVKNIYSPVNITNLQKYAELLNWLNQNTPKDSTVYILNESINLLIPIYTRNNVYFATYAGFSMVSDEELENRWAIKNFFNDVGENNIKNNRDIWSNKFIDSYQSKESQRKIKQLITGNEYPQKILIEQIYIDRVLLKLEKFRQMGFEKALKTYKVDYVVLDTRDSNYSKLENTFEKFIFLELVTNLNDIVIYKVR